MGLFDFLLSLFGSKTPAGPAAANPRLSPGLGGPNPLAPSPGLSRRQRAAQPITPQRFAPGRLTFRRLMGCLRLNHVRVRRVMHSPHAYSAFTIPKRDGSPRTILAPCRSLKHIQRRILQRIVAPLDTHDAAHGFRRRRSIATNAAPHANQEMVLSVDLADFFPSISAKRIYGLFRKLGWPQNVASMLTRLTTCHGCLPQGAPTSPALANLIARRLDRRIEGLAHRRNLAYTRYADDLTLSGPADQVRKALPMVRGIIIEEGFLIAEKKVRFMRRGRRQLVAGLVVNDRLSTPRAYRRRIRAAIHRLATGRLPPGASDYNAAILQCRGHVNFIRSIHAPHAAPLATELSAARERQG